MGINASGKNIKSPQYQALVKTDLHELGPLTLEKLVMHNNEAKTIHHLFNLSMHLLPDLALPYSLNASFCAPKQVPEEKP